MKPYHPTITEPTLKAFIYGDPGAGKTTFLATAMDDPRTSPMFLINCAGNPESIRRRPNLPYVVTLENTKDMNHIYDWFGKGQPAEHSFTKFLKDYGFPELPRVPFKSLGFDVVTEYQRMALDEITGNDKKRPGDDLKFAERRDWGQALARVSMIARFMYKLPLSVFIAGWEKADKDENTGIISYAPSLWGQAQGEVPGYSLLTMRFVRQGKLSTNDKKQVEEQSARTYAYCDQLGRFQAKEQYGGIPVIMSDPTIPKLMTAVYGETSVG